MIYKKKKKGLSIFNTVYVKICFKLSVCVYLAEKLVVILRYQQQTATLRLGLLLKLQRSRERTLFLMHAQSQNTTSPGLGKSFPVVTVWGTELVLIQWAIKIPTVPLYKVLHFISVRFASNQSVIQASLKIP